MKEINDFEKVQKELSTAIKIYSWTIGIAIGVLIGFLIYTL